MLETVRRVREGLRREGFGETALIGFAGPRVIENTVREKLPEGFQRAEFLLQKGAIDMIVDRRRMRDEVARLIALLGRQPQDPVISSAAPAPAPAPAPV